MGTLRVCTSFVAFVLAAAQQVNIRSAMLLFVANPVYNRKKRGQNSGMIYDVTYFRLAVALSLRWSSLMRREHLSFSRLYSSMSRFNLLLSSAGALGPPAPPMPILEP